MNKQETCCKKSLAGCETDDQARKKDPMDSDTHLQTRSMFLLDEMHSTNHAAFDLTGRQATALNTYCCYQLCPACSLTKAAMLVSCHSKMARNKAGQLRQASIGSEEASVLPAMHGSCTQPDGAAWPSELQQPLDAVLHAAMLARHGRLASARLFWHDCWPLHLPLAVCCMSACNAMQQRVSLMPAARLMLTC